VLAVFVSGVGGAALPLALVLMVRAQTGSFATAGAVVAALGLAVGLFNPIRGRLVDRKGQRQLVPLALVHACCLGGLVALAVADAAAWMLIVAAVVAGAAPAPLMSSLRALWRDLVPGPSLQSAYALQAVLTEALFVAFPLLAALLVATFSAEVAVLVLVVVELAGVIGFAARRASRDWRSEPREPGSLGALGSPGMRTLTLASLPYGMVLSRPLGNALAVRPQRQRVPSGTRHCFGAEGVTRLVGHGAIDCGSHDPGRGLPGRGFRWSLRRRHGYSAARLPARPAGCPCPVRAVPASRGRRGRRPAL
jgi:MFS family permease